MTLRRWQGEALRAVAAAWQTQPRVLVVAATGAGKSRLFSEVAVRCHKAGRGRTLVLAPLIDLVDQAAKSLSAIGLTVEVEQGDRMASLYPGMWGGSDVVCACTASMTGRRLTRWPQDAFSRIIVDEAHTQAGSGPRAILERFSGAKVLAVTATPESSTVEVYGQPVFTYDIEDAIRDGVLCPVSSKAILLDTVSIDQVRMAGKDLDAEELGKAMTPTRETIAAVCKVVLDEAGDRQTVAFLPTVESAHAYRYEMGGLLGADLVDSLDGTTPKDIRAESLKRFKEGKTRVMMNCALFTMGVDLPSVRCVAVLRPTKSATLFRQMVGRGLRTHPGKDDCLVLTIDTNTPDLCGTVDLFAPDLPSDIKAQAQRAIMSGQDAEEVVAKARERAARIRAILDREKAERIEMKVSAEVRLTNLFAAGGMKLDPSLAGGPRISGAQAEALRKAYGPAADKMSLAKLSQKQYRALMNPVKDRREKGLCTIRQSIVLQKNGLPGDMTFEEARAALDRLASNGWRVG